MSELVCKVLAKDDLVIDYDLSYYCIVCVPPFVTLVGLATTGFVVPQPIDSAWAVTMGTCLFSGLYGAYIAFWI